MISVLLAASGDFYALVIWCLFLIKTSAHNNQPFEKWKTYSVIEQTKTWSISCINDFNLPRKTPPVFVTKLADTINISWFLIKILNSFLLWLFLKSGKLFQTKYALKNAKFVQKWMKRADWKLRTGSFSKLCKVFSHLKVSLMNSRSKSVIELNISVLRCCKCFR